MPPLFNRRSEIGLPASLPPVALPLAELMARVRQTLTDRFAESYWVVAEIADLTLPRFDGAHCYLVLTDQHTTGRGAQLKAQARATIWSQRYQQLAPAFLEQTGQELSIGIKVMLRVQVKFHEQYGLSLDVVAIDPTYTVGDLARQRLETIRKLEAKDLLERQKRLSLAIGPQRLAVISSPTAAGFQDFMQQLSESAYDFSVALFPASMQGAEAPSSILSALDMIRRQRHTFDVVILIRGGGAKTDLLAFDDYGLAAAVGSFPLPVLTGIGHERDEAVTDLAAHLALKTPTAVAAFLTERLGRLDAVFEGYALRIRELATEQLQDAATQLRRLTLRTRETAQDKLAFHRSALHQQLRQARETPRTHLRRQQQQLATQRRALHRAARQALRRQQGALRTLGKLLARRFRHLHRRRREQLLRYRYQLQLATARQLHLAELRLARATAHRLPNAETAPPSAAAGIRLLDNNNQPLTPDRLRAGTHVRLQLPDDAVLIARIIARLSSTDGSSPSVPDLFSQS
ncbi:exodeoxyribonuclease VII large subunit [Hymenobacter sp. GOD-10R]|uniref:exodeoxyribonuclease VII large subunit n=1 Tax=Hymenobacter sp. GOD-10R TaxID=3093922 RepID=UPI002D78061F|nr:exodeoxyribonuclease VII large subunit [Hymenobacter sp. GOD-10R]WRQ27322.1 exodeoxyribonuclease VII large subunit [Hymenobacter sp. GOD-10R]